MLNLSFLFNNQSWRIWIFFLRLVNWWCTHSFCVTASFEIPKQKLSDQEHLVDGVHVRKVIPESLCKHSVEMCFDTFCVCVGVYARLFARTLQCFYWYWVFRPRLSLPQRFALSSILGGSSQRRGQPCVFSEMQCNRKCLPKYCRVIFNCLSSHS